LTFIIVIFFFFGHSYEVLLGFVVIVIVVDDDYSSVIHSRHGRPARQPETTAKTKVPKPKMMLPVRV
jgi:hypothetical protein